MGTQHLEYGFNPPFSLILLNPEGDNCFSYFLLNKGEVKNGED